MNLKTLLEKNIAFNGHLIQKVVAVEELSELTKEITKELRGIGSLRNLSEEIADVEIMLEQMKLIFNNSDLVEMFKVEKLERIKRSLDL